MNDEERRDSLADQAAAWVPPWDRPRPPAPTDPPAPTAPADAVAGPDPADAAAGPDASGVEPGRDLGRNRPLEGPQSSKISSASGESAEAGPDRGTEAPPEGPERTKIGAPADGAPRPRRRATVVPEPAPQLDDAELRGALEAILLVVDEPVSELVLAQVLEQPAERIGPVLDEIAAGYTAAGHGFELRRAAGGWRLYTRPEYATYVERFVLDGQSVRLTQAALETLAVVAYKQPVTRSRISAIRGVNCDGVIRTLVSRGLIEECGTESDSGAFLYRTTTMFLEKLGLNSVGDLPPLAPFLPDDVEELADATR
ncbi:SMC-Scp complex subunit ScpB [Micromonospora sp. NPDC049497]|uniref:SMC-Scp complex subunit ScpB n=1 Tax=Micromonospora sp. NPDC049497 TaxID=3364273 RepID=UPI0037A1DDBF